MTATDELRRMLDERGVEWWQSANTLGCIFTRWHSPIFGDEVVAMENGEEGLVLFDHFVTPEQAIAATLGRGTCHVKAVKKIGNLFGFSLSCGHSMVNPFDDRPDYCPWCGRKVVDEWTAYETQPDGTLREVADPPTRADLVQVVRCRDCKYATPDTSGRKRYKGYLWCDKLTDGIGFSVAPSGFCAWGECKEADA